MRVSVLTPTLPERQSLLNEAKASVAAQTVPVEHRISTDDLHWGPGPVRTNLAIADADWFLPLDDDDLLDPDCIEVLLEHTDGADIVYPWCRVEGLDNWSPNRRFSPDALLQFNYIPATCLIRGSLVRELRGWRPVPSEDWDFNKRALAAGARFRCVDEVLWTYRVRAGSRNEWDQYGF